MKVTVCSFDDPDFIAGPNSWLGRLLPALREQGHAVHVLIFKTESSGEYPLIDSLTKSKISFQTAPWWYSTEKKVRWILDCCTENPPEIFMPNMVVAAFYASRWIKEAGIPTIGLCHSDDEFNHAIANAFALQPGPYQVSALVCVSKYLLEAATQSCKSNVKLCNIPYCVPVSDITTRSPKSDFRIIWLGRLENEQKQILKTAEALCKATQLNQNVSATIYGLGQEKENLVQLLNKIGNSKVTYGGVIKNSEVQQSLRRFHAIALLSDYEGLPISLLEAMSCGVVPIVLKTKSGVAELVEHNVNGLIVENREGSFQSAVQKLASNQDLWKKFSVASHQKIAAQFSPEAEVRRWETLFSELKTSGTIKSIKIPHLLGLPPVRAEFAREDKRKSDLISRIFRKIAA